MSIQKVKTNSSKKSILTVILMFLVMIIVLSLNNSVFAASVKITSIGGEEWNISDANIDYNLARTLHNIMNISGDDMVSQTLPEIDYITPGYRIGATNTDMNSFNRAATIGDCGTYNNKGCQMVCIHPSVNLDDASATSIVQKVLFLSKENITVYYTGADEKVHEESDLTGSYSEYFDKVLRDLYKVQQGTKDASDLEHIWSILYDHTFHERIYDSGCMNWQLDTNDRSTLTPNGSQDDFEYFGVFAYIGTGTAGSQGRLMFNVYREEPTIDTPIKLTFTKTDMNGTKTSNKATIRIECGDNAKFANSTKTSVSKTIGTKSVNIKPEDNDKGYFKLNLTETKAPKNYEGYTETVTLTVKYNKETREVTEVKPNKNASNFSISFVNNEVQVKIKNKYIPPIEIGPDVDGLGLNKYGKGTTQPISGVKFQAIFKQDGETIATKEATSDNTGHVSFDKVEPKSTQKVTVTITEIETPKGWKGDFSKTIEFTYDDSDTSKVKWKTTDSKVKVQLSEDKKTTQVGLVDPAENPGIIEQLTILKKDPLNPNANLDGAKFKITLTNISKVGESNYTSAITREVKDGKIVLKDLEIKNLSNDIKITIEETETPPEKDGIRYKQLDGQIIITLKRNGDQYVTHNVSTTGNILESEVKIGNIAVNNHVVELIVNNLPIIDLSGRVWIDGQDGIKDAFYNGKCDSSDKKVEGIEVCLVDSKGNKVVQSGLQNPVYTNSNGEYKFENVIATKDGFKVQFKYNGIMYKGLGNYEDSDAVEVGRADFNAKFKTITAQGALSSSNDVTALKYDYTDKEAMLKISNSLNIKTAVSEDPAKGETYAEQSIVASTEDSEIYYTTTNNIDCGLLEKYFDLSTENLIDKVEYKINGKEWVDDSNPDKKEDYTEMQKSDYYYRFDDYGETKKEDFSTGDDQNPTNYEHIGFNAENELSVQAYYNLNIINQSIHEVSQVVIKYTYNNNIYTFDKIGEVAGVTCEVVSDKELKITVSNWDKNKDTIEIPIIFNLKKDESLAAKIDTGLESLTTVEIISYTTKDGGLIDNDSEPGNGKVGEDDLSQAKLTFKFAETARKISGNVAEDTNKDGTLDSAGINDVIVQLIEIVQKGENKFEYIWQETTSGSSEVKARGIDKEVYKYKVQNNPGQYQFLGHSANAQDSTGNNKVLNTGFIPGDYIVRFIYGDGTSVDLNADGTINNNVAKYNGQDYKSTIDMNYQAADYDPSKYNGKSTARDNEARRLQVMAFSTEIDGKLGVALKTLNVQEFNDLNEEEQELLKQYYSELQQKNDRRLKYAYGRYKNVSNPELPVVDSISDSEVFNIVKHYISYETWMCAETSKIDVKGDKSNSQFTEVNFGLAKRPETKLTLEKHITSLIITPTGTGVYPVVNAKADINQILSALERDGESIQTTGLTSDLAIIGSTRGNRGFWKLETDIEELMQGAKVEVDYTYVIRNDSETDYLSKILVNAYEGHYTNDDGTPGAELGKTYKEFLKDIHANYSGTIGTYLGSYYYTGNESAADIGTVKSTVESLQEAINNKLTFTSSDEFDSINLTEGNNKYNYYDENGNKKEITIKTLIKSKNGTGKLAIEEKDTSKKVSLETTLASSGNGETGINIASYIAEVTAYTNAAGRENFEAVPENLSYVHSDDTRLALDSYVKKDANGNIIDVKTEKTDGYIKLNEIDEFWGESIIISKPTGANKNTAMIITIIAISGAAVIGVGIILIKKFVIKK